MTPRSLIFFYIFLLLRSVRSNSEILLDYDTTQQPQIFGVEVKRERQGQRQPLDFGDEKLRGGRPLDFGDVKSRASQPLDFGNEKSRAGQPLDFGDEKSGAGQQGPDSDFRDGKTKGREEGQRGHIPGITDFFNSRRNDKASTKMEKSLEPLKPEFGGSSPRDGILRLVDILLSLSNLPAFPQPSSGPFNYGNGRKDSLPPPLSLLTHYLIHPNWKINKGLEVGGPSVGALEDLEIQKDPTLSLSVNQLLHRIYDTQGILTSQDEHRHLPLHISPSLPHYTPYTTHFPFFNPWNLLRNEGKRSATNSGYICHFKLCQFGSSGKRRYKPQTRSNYENE